MSRAGWGIKPLRRTTIPQRHIVLAALPALSGGHGHWRESWRVAATATITRRPAGRWRLACYGDDTPARLWAEISAATDPRGQTYVWAHDLTRVLRLTDALRHLPEHGWELRRFSLRPGAPWLSWRRGRATLRLVDTMSIWPDSLDRLGELFGRGRSVPAPTDTDVRLWMAGVVADRDIVSAAVQSYLDWVAAEDLGNLSVTGNGQAFNAFRRRFLTHGIVVHDDDALHRMERTAMWTGRAEAYWHGSLGVATVTEWDFSRAHTRIAADTYLPVWPGREIVSGGTLAAIINPPGVAALATVRVRTDVPVVPTRVGEHIVWPVGQFTTTLWQPELELLALEGCEVEILGGRFYRTAPVLRAWAQWVLAQSAPDAADIPAWLKEIVRRWGNALVGRFAMHYPTWTEIGRVPYADAFAMPTIDVDTAQEGTLMQVGRVLWEQDGEALPHNHAPAITGYVMSAMRAQLWRVLRELPPRTVLYCDTDSLLVTASGEPYVAALAQTAVGAGLRRKRSWDGMAIYGPRQIVVGDMARVSGLPRGAVRTGRHDWAGQVVESMEHALAGRAADSVRTDAREWTIAGVDPRRAGHGVGWTTPLAVDLP